MEFFKSSIAAVKNEKHVFYNNIYCQHSVFQFNIDRKEREKTNLRCRLRLEFLINFGLHIDTYAVHSLGILMDLL